jgi:hypothetical protein
MKVIVNGKEVEIEGTDLSYDAAVIAAGKTPGTVLYTVTVSMRIEGGSLNSHLTPGQSIPMRGTRILVDVAHTGNA